jgi:pumilio RNA-binding family
MLEFGSSVDELSEYDDSPDALFDASAAPHDSKSYASSETSTTVSRSARRRRGRRAAKAKAGKASMVIVETPVPEELLVTEDRKMELAQQLDAGGEATRRAVSSLYGHVLRMSLEPFGCRVVQKALDVANTFEKERLVAELRNHVRLAISSPHANFVIQKVIEVLPINATSFVAQELATFAAEVARHRFGCRVLSRLVEHHLCGNGVAPSTDVLIDEVLLQTDQLIHHNFARHVLELILEHGTDAHKEKISESVRNNLFHLSKNRCASYVVEKALAFCKVEDTYAIASELLRNPERFRLLAMHECGSHVVKAVMKSHADCAQKAKELLKADIDKLKSSKYGKQFLDEM